MAEDRIKAVKGVDRIGALTRKIMNITRYQAKPYLESHIVDIEQAAGDEIK